MGPVKIMAKDLVRTRYTISCQDRLTLTKLNINQSSCVPQELRD